MCAAAALSTGVALMNVYSHVRTMHTVNPNELFLAIMTGNLLGRRSHSRIRRCNDGNVQQSKEAILTIEEEPKDLHYKQRNRQRSPQHEASNKEI